MNRAGNLYGLSGDPEVQRARRFNFGSGSVWTLLASCIALISLMNLTQHASLLALLLSGAAGVTLVWGLWLTVRSRHSSAEALPLAVTLAYALNAAASLSAAVNGHWAAGMVLLGFLPLMIVRWQRRSRQS